MPIIPGSNFRFRGEKYLDDRQSVDKISDLLNWSDPLPDGFEIYCKEARDWYTYDWRYESVETGHFKLRGQHEVEGNSQDEYDIPIYRYSVAQDLNKSDCITIPDIDGTVDSDLVYKVTQPGSYTEILFSAVRELLKEVAKLRNSFKYGIESYQGSITALSSTNQDLASEIEDEPLWAIEEDGLSLIVDCLQTSNIQVTPSSGLTIVKDSTTSYSYFKFNNQATWLFEDSVVDALDPKVFIYLTTDSLNIKLNLDGGSRLLNLDFSQLPLSKIPEHNLYNILFVLSKTQISGDNTYGKNFIWISILDPISDTVLAEGYLNGNQLSQNLVLIANRYKLLNAVFNDNTITKFIIYSKYQDFSKDIIPSRPTDETYKYKVAHLTIRSVTNETELRSIKDRILNNELVIVEETKQLWTKINNKLTTLAGATSSGGNTGGGDFGDETMTQEELIEALEEMGIIYTSSTGSLEITDLNLGDITFIHEATGKKFKFYINENGELCNQEIASDNLDFEKNITTKQINFEEHVRGFIGQYRGAIDNKAATADFALSSDRVKIGAFYAPFDTDQAHGCSHSFVELENTSDQDYSLKGCYLHYTRPNSEGVQVVYHLPLTGIIPAGGTYLIRGAQHALYDDVNTFIKVKTFDQEWYNNGLLMSFEIDSTKENGGYGFALTYKNADLSETANLYKDNPKDFSTADLNTSTYPYVYDPSFIDALYYHKKVQNASGAGYWSLIAVELVSNSMYRNTFMLDPAKQAFQALNTKDSSRSRWANVANDIQVLKLGREYIEFPHTSDKVSVSMFTPKASYEHKNVSTDKTKLDMQKPNMVTCSFGVDIYHTRCFNWISMGYFDEYIWIAKDGETNWTRFESYKTIPTVSTPTVLPQASTTIDGNKTIEKTYSETNSTVPTGLHRKEYYTLHTITVTTKTTESVEGSDPTVTTETGTYLTEYVDTYSVNNIVYARMTGRFPGDNSYYTSHKCIIDGLNNTFKTKYKYIVGRADKNGNPDLDHCSDTMYFTVYPDSYQPKIYHTTDQQGFTWVEYQVWAAAAKTLNDIITSDCEANNIIPILMNTGDMTQNGTRVNEWLDYYNGGKVLFNHLEQMNVVGNNDLCGSNPFILGTGDDNGKSNAYYFHVFYCYEVGNLFTPIVNNKYIPSLYYFDTKNTRIVMINSEITETTCKTWFKRTKLDSNNVEKAVNIYTGFTVDGINQIYDNGFTTIYTMLYDTFANAQNNGLSIITVCHEMPFTVITNKCINNTYKNVSRSINESGALVGSHMNQISKNEVGNKNDKTPKGIYWFSRLLEHFGIKLCLGGHKHTYTCTYPVREWYKYTVDEVEKDSFTDGKMTMPRTLENDSIQFLNNGIDMSKFPLVKRDFTQVTEGDSFYPCSDNSNTSLTGGVIYFMCQATGYKLTSNKELPSANQKFSQLLPQTTVKSGKDSPNGNLKYPMFATVDITDTTFELMLSRLNGILGASSAFKQDVYSTGPIVRQYIKLASNNDYGVWGNTVEKLLSISK